MAATILVIGIGNESRADDAAGLFVARRLNALNLSQVCVLEHSGEGAGLIDAWEHSGAELVILIDAVCSGTESGTIYRLDVNKQTIPTSFFNYSTHAFSLAEAIELARVLGKLPHHAVIYGIEGAEYTPGEDLSAVVAQAIPTTLAQIVAEIEATLRNISGGTSQ